VRCWRPKITSTSFSRRAIVLDPEGIITSGHDNKTARTISFYEGGKVNTRALRKRLKQVVANNWAGGWRKLKATQPSSDTQLSF
jgi:hypothetical protein